MKKVTNIFLLLFALQVLNSTNVKAQCQGSKTLDVSTGINNAGVNLPTTGVIDPFWKLTNLPPLASSFTTGYAIPNLYTIPNGTAALGSGFPSWLNIPGTIALNVIPNPYFSDNNLNSAQPWRMVRKFSVTNAGTVAFSGSFISDDVGTLKIFDVGGTQYFSTVGIGHSAVANFVDSFILTKGCYYLEVTVGNVGAFAMGFAVDGLLASDNAILSNTNAQCCGGATISGQKWIDNNCNGKLDNIDLPGSGWVFNLMSGATIIQTTTTNSLGEFYFTNVPLGTYTVSEVLTPGYSPSLPSSGSYSVNLNKNDTIINLLFLNCKDTLPSNPCAQDALTEINYKPADTNGSCCYNLSLGNYGTSQIGTISFTGIGSTEFALSTTGLGWSYSGVSTPSFREVSALPIGVGTGLYTDILKLCITSATPGPHYIAVNYTDVSGEPICADTLIIDQCILTPNNCITISQDSLYCIGNKKYLKLQLTNNAPFPIREITYYVSDSTKITIDRNTDTFSVANAILPGATSSEIILQLNTINGGASTFCIQLSAYDGIHTATSAPTNCCSDSTLLCFPFEHCTLDGCCEFTNTIIPNGITPNGDGKNDKWVILAPSLCDTISMQVFNRWGNKVYEDKHYLNTWQGTNQTGDKLPQGTYFVIIELPCGSKKGLYVDVRY